MAAEVAIRNGTRLVAPMGNGVDLVAVTSPKIVLWLLVGVSLRKAVHLRQERAKFLPVLIVIAMEQQRWREKTRIQPSNVSTSLQELSVERGRQSWFSFRSKETLIKATLSATSQGNLVPTSLGAPNRPLSQSCPISTEQTTDERQ